MRTIHLNYKQNTRSLRAHSVSDNKIGQQTGSRFEKNQSDKCLGKSSPDKNDTRLIYSIGHQPHLKKLSNEKTFTRNYF